MNKKQETLSLILEVMRKEQITLHDIEVELAFKACGEKQSFQNYDLLCLRDNRKYRLPFEIGKDLNPIGIFPFQDSNIYLECAERNGEFRYRAFEERLPEYAFFERMFKVRNELNAHLLRLSKPQLLGKYFTKLSEDKMVWTVGFVPEKNEMLKFGYSPTARAKARYVGKF